jgi:hypothetical protein
VQQAAKGNKTFDNHMCPPPTTGGSNCDAFLLDALTNLDLGRERTMSHKKPSTILNCIVAAVITLVFSTPAAARTIYVSAGGTVTGTGTRSAPYHSLDAVEQSSAPGDVIVVLASPPGTPPLNGGIKLKVGQSLQGDGPAIAQASAPLTAAARVTNTTEANNGDAVTLADNSSVSNLLILNARRSGVYGQDVTGITVAGNDISASNTSCVHARGFGGSRYGDRAMNGYAAVMIDYAYRDARLSVVSNRIHDGFCMDGIHIRAGGKSVVNGRIDKNVITRLHQGKMFVAVIGIMLETKDNATLAVTSDGNSQTWIGNLLGGVADADCEGLLTHQLGGDLRWTITNNYFAHAPGGASCNGAEFFITEGKTSATIAISDSQFIDAQGDMLQNINLGSGETTLTLERVTIAYTRLSTDVSGAPNPIGSTPAGNEAGRPRGHCVMLVSHGPGGSNRAKISDSHFSNCSGDGLFMFYAPFVSDPGSYRDLSLDIDHSTITTESGYGLRWANYGSLERASVTVRNSLIAGALDKAAIALVQNPSSATIRDATFDFGTAVEPGGNCIGFPGPKALVVEGLNANFVGNFWGANPVVPPADGTGNPLADTISLNAGKVDTSSPMTAAPATCGHM